MVKYSQEPDNQTKSCKDRGSDLPCHLKGSSIAMEGSSSQMSDSSLTASGASISLYNLPSRGLFSAPVLSLNPGRIRVCVCEYETSLPEDKHVKTDQQNILIRSLKIKKQKDKGDSSSKDAKGAGTTEGSRKRVAERVLDSRAPVKKPSTQPRQEESSSQASSRDFQGLTVERLRALLKAKGLSVKGKKEELIARLRSSHV